MLKVKGQSYKCRISDTFRWLYNFFCRLNLNLLFCQRVRFWLFGALEKWKKWDLINGAEKRTWTSTSQSSLAPEASASTNSATSAKVYIFTATGVRTSCPLFELKSSRPDILSVVRDSLIRRSPNSATPGKVLLDQLIRDRARTLPIDKANVNIIRMQYLRIFPVDCVQCGFYLKVH